MNGPPWNTRIAVRVHNYIPDKRTQTDTYSNRAILFQELRWGRLVRWETYEDTQRIADWDARISPTSGQAIDPAD